MDISPGKLNLPPVSFFAHIHDGFKLCLANFASFSSLALLEGLPDAENNFEPGIDRCASLGCDESRVLMEKCSAFRVAYTMSKASSIQGHFAHQE
jgi:hypothetical protein